MNRREAGVALLLGALALAARPTHAQMAGKVYRIGYLSQPTRASVEPAVAAFLRALHDLGWVEGRNIAIDYRWAEGDVERLPALAEELVRRNVDLIVAPATAAALAAKRATRTIPIVMIFPPDPVAVGLVASLGRPAGNVTGTTFAPGGAIYGKQLQLLLEAVPRATRVAMLRNPADPGSELVVREVGSAARSMRIRLQQHDARGPDELDRAFAAMARGPADALLVAASPTFMVHRAQLAELAVKGRLPTMFSVREMVEAGGLMAYSVNMVEFIGHAAGYVDRILRGANPGELPVEQPTKFELVVNARTARAIGLALPPSLLQRADAVIE